MSHWSSERTTGSLLVRVRGQPATTQGKTRSYPKQDSREDDYLFHRCCRSRSPSRRNRRPNTQCKGVTYSHRITCLGHTPSFSTPCARRARGTNRHLELPADPNGGVSITIRFGGVSNSGARGLRERGTPVAARGSKDAKKSVEPFSRRIRAGCVGSISPGLVPVRVRGIGRRDGPAEKDTIVSGYCPTRPMQRRGPSRFSRRGYEK